MKRTSNKARGLLAALFLLTSAAALAADTAEEEPKIVFDPCHHDAGHKAPETSPGVVPLGRIECIEAPAGGVWFEPDPEPDADQKDDYNPDDQLAVYNAKHLNKTAFPPLLVGLRLFDRGAYTPRPTWLGEKNPILFHFMAYGDLRVAGAFYDNGGPGKTEQSAIATRVNLDLDLALTATERIHAFVRPFDTKGSTTRYLISGAVDDEFVDEFDFDIETLFFEGDLGAMLQGWTGKTSMLDLPIAIGRVPLNTQNGIWLNAAFDGAAIGITAKHSAKYDISNFDVTFFAGFGNVPTAAVAAGEDANVYGIAGFADVFKGYVEVGYGYLDADDGDHSYHNVSAAFTKRYFGHLANSVRVIGNIGQKGIGGVKTADGVLVLIENSFFRRNPITLVPYLNLFAGFDSPQPLARAADFGGVLTNTGINFESDGMTRYPTLDATAQDSWGGAFGVEYLFDLTQQIVVEAAVVERMGSSTAGSEYALGVRFQRAITNAWIVRADAMNGWREGRDDVFGVRLEIRRKF